MKRRVYLTEEEKKMSGDQIATKYGVHRSSGFRAKKIGWIVPGYFNLGRYVDAPHQVIIKREDKPVPEVGEFIVLTDDDRELSGGELATKYGVSERAALRARKRGWIGKVRQAGRKIDVLPNHALPEGIVLESVTEDAKSGARMAAKHITYKFLVDQEFDDMYQHALARLMELTANPDFISGEWRRAVAKTAALEWLIRKEKSLWPGRKRGSGDEAEDIADERNIFGENTILLAEIRNEIGERKWGILWDWATSSIKRIPAEVSTILREVRDWLGLDVLSIA